MILKRQAEFPAPSCQASGGVLFPRTAAAALLQAFFPKVVTGFIHRQFLELDDWLRRSKSPQWIMTVERGRMEKRDSHVVHTLGGCGRVRSIHLSVVSTAAAVVLPQECSPSAPGFQPTSLQTASEASDSAPIRRIRRPWWRSTSPSKRAKSDPNFTHRASFLRSLHSSRSCPLGPRASCPRKLDGERPWIPLCSAAGCAKPEAGSPLPRRSHSTDQASLRTCMKTQSGNRKFASLCKRNGSDKLYKRSGCHRGTGLQVQEIVLAIIAWARRGSG
jgi:hypothetical protein